MANELDALLSRLQAAIEARSADAIDAEIARPARQTAVQSLSEAPEVVAFRDELVNGLIRADTANQLLRLVATVVERLL